MSNYRVQFEVFEGPLDLLLHLVKKEEVDIYEVNLTRIANEFIAYLNQMQELDLEVAGEFVVMAATLIFIKSRELLPRDQQSIGQGPEEEEGDDPRFELIRRLVEYKKFKDAAAQLQSREAEMGCIYEHRLSRLEFPAETNPRRSEISLFDLIGAVSSILKRYNTRDDIDEISADPYTVSEKMEELRILITTRSSFRFSDLFLAARSRTEVVVIFLAMLELIRLKQFVCFQSADFGEIEISTRPETAENLTHSLDILSSPTSIPEASSAPISAPTPVPDSNSISRQDADPDAIDSSCPPPAAENSQPGVHSQSDSVSESARPPA
ncbi:MAG: segregation/condensation protein A [Pedosphaera sp.]|nr:segregation/condensation protein A [Pedosphaera sp.]